MSYESVIALQLVLIAALAIRAVFCHSMISQLKSCVLKNSTDMARSDYNHRREVEILNNEIKALSIKSSLLEHEVLSLTSKKLDNDRPARIAEDGVNKMRRIGGSWTTTLLHVRDPEEGKPYA